MKRNCIARWLSACIIMPVLMTSLVFCNVETVRASSEEELTEGSAGADAEGIADFFSKKNVQEETDYSLLLTDYLYDLSTLFADLESYDYQNEEDCQYVFHKLVTGDGIEFVRKSPMKELYENVRKQKTDLYSIPTGDVDKAARGLFHTTEHDYTKFYVKMMNLELTDDLGFLYYTDEERNKIDGTAALTDVSKNDNIFTISYVFDGEARDSNDILIREIHKTGQAELELGEYEGQEYFSLLSLQCEDNAKQPADGTELSEYDRNLVEAFIKEHWSEQYDSSDINDQLSMLNLITMFTVPSEIYHSPFWNPHADPVVRIVPVIGADEDSVWQFSSGVYNISQDAFEQFKKAAAEIPVLNPYVRYSDGWFYWMLTGIPEFPEYITDVQIINIVCSNGVIEVTYNARKQKADEYNENAPFTQYIAEVGIKEWFGRRYCSLYSAHSAGQPVGQSEIQETMQQTDAAEDNRIYVRVYNTFNEGLALKEQADINSTRFLLIPDGTDLVLDEIKGTWGHTQYNGLTGWVALRYTLITGDFEAQLPSFGSTESYTMTVYGTGAEGLELRTRPSTEYSSFGNIPEGTVLTIEAVENDWAYTSYNGHYGWVHTSFLQ